MGAGSSCDSLETARLTNRAPFSAAIGSWRAAVPPLPAFKALGGPHRARVIARKRPLFASEEENE